VLIIVAVAVVVPVVAIVLAFLTRAFLVWTLAYRHRRHGTAMRL
jgi:phosphate/sulfate permease